MISLDTEHSKLSFVCLFVRTTFYNQEPVCLNRPHNTGWFKKDKLIGIGGVKIKLAGENKISLTTTLVVVKRMRRLHSVISPQGYERALKVWRSIKWWWWVRKVEEDITVSYFPHTYLSVTPIALSLSASHAPFQPLPLRGRKPGRSFVP